jgi:hypothetical protein
MLVIFFGLPKMILLASCSLVFPFRYLAMIKNEPISARFNLMFAAIGKALYLFGMLFVVGLIYG